MDCLQVNALIPDYTVELLPARERALVEGHLAACEACRAELRRLEQVMALVEQHAALEPPAGMWNAVATRIAAEPRRTGFQAFLEGLRGRRARVVWGGAAALAAAAGIWLAASSGNAPATVNGPTPQADATIRATVRQHVESLSQGPLANRTAWEAIAQRVEGEGQAPEREEERPSRPQRDWPQRVKGTR